MTKNNRHVGIWRDIIVVPDNPFLKCIRLIIMMMMLYYNKDISLTLCYMLIVLIYIRELYPSDFVTRYESLNFYGTMVCGIILLLNSTTFFEMGTANVFFGYDSGFLPIPNFLH